MFVDGAEDDLTDLSRDGVEDEEKEDGDERQQQQQHQDAPVPAPDEEDESLQGVHKPVEGSFGAAVGGTVESHDQETPAGGPTSLSSRYLLGLFQRLGLFSSLPNWPVLCLLHSQQFKLRLNLPLEGDGEAVSGHSPALSQALATALRTVRM